MSNQIDVDHLAKLAKLTVSKEEKKKLADQLKRTVNKIEILDELDTKDIKPSFQVTAQTNVSQKDTPEKGLSQKQALSNAKRRKDGYFVVEKIKWEN